MPGKKPSSPLDTVVRRGIRISRPGFTLYFKTLSGKHRPRIVISHKVDKRAVVRNRLRRRIRAILVPYLAAGSGVVIICRPELAGFTKDELTLALNNVLKRLPWPR